ncbi:MAG TPA: protein kinase [Ktedonobacteraceae bacterium]|nr:protein kinase [Ktedonobacteraceae bacterium]
MSDKRDIMPRCPNPRCQADYPPGSMQCTNPFCQCLLPGAVVAGRYRIETLIGLGGMGAVYRVSDTFEMEQVALKVLNLANSSMDIPTAVERFRREARYAHQLKHKNIVPILNFGQDGNLLYLVMPLVTGGTLKALLKGERPLPIQQAQQYLNDLADAVDAVHAHPQQVVHRDIKPSNLLIQQDDGRLVLADFGIARAMQQEKALTQRGFSLGTEHYIAPEQEHGKAEPASDIYSMGVVAYQMFTGLLPYQAVIKNHAAEIPAPSSLNIALPPAVDDVIFRAIDIDPTMRYPSGRAFADALNDALSTEDLWSQPTISANVVATSSPNIIVRAIVPENPCSLCGRENRGSSRFCRHCGHSLDDTSPTITDICQVGYVSDIGQRARQNEDMLLIVQGLCVNLEPPPRPFILFAVADGLLGPYGKAAGGHEASRLAIETITDIMLPLLSTPPRSSTQSAASSGRRQPSRSLYEKQPPEQMLESWLKDAVRQANQVVYHCNADYDTTMASTLTAALLYKQRLYVASVGDSRAYHYDCNRKWLSVITVDTPAVKPTGVDTSANRSSQPRYLGQAHQIHIDLFQSDVEPGDTILLCTDGLWHMLRDERIQLLLEQSQNDPVEKQARLLVDAANSAGGEGNVSAIVVRVQ